MHSHISSIEMSTFVCLLLLWVLLLGCNEDLRLRDDFPQPFTLYGVLSPDLDTQSVRLYPLDDFPLLHPTESLDISFFSTDLTTGERLVWQDTLLIEPNGQHDLVFWAPFRAEFDHLYRVEAVRQNDGAMSSAEVKIPSPVSVSIVELDSPNINEVFIKVFIEGDNIRVLKPELVYTVKGSDSQFGLGDVLSITRRYHKAEQPFEMGWEFTFNMYLDRYRVQGEYNVLLPAFLGIRCQVLDLRKLDLHLIVGNSDWDPPEGDLDPNLLSHQNALTNVENGLGFIGGGYRIVESLRPSREAVEKACFTYVW